MFEALVNKLKFKFSFLYQTFPNYTCKICKSKKNFMFFIDDVPVCPECLPTFFEKDFLPLLISKIILTMKNPEVKDV